MADANDILAEWLNSAGLGGIRNSMVAYQGTGSRTDFSFNFSGGYIAAEDIKAYTFDSATGVTAQAAISLIATGTAKVSPAPKATQTLVIYRDTFKGSPLVDFATGAPMTEQNLDLMAKQAVFAVAELVDRFDSTRLSSTTATQTAAEAKTRSEEALRSTATAQAAAEAAASSASTAATLAGQAKTTADDALRFVSSGASTSADNTFSGANTFAKPVTVAAPTAAGHAARRADVDAANAAAVAAANSAASVRVAKTGDTMTGNLTQTTPDGINAAIVLNRYRSGLSNVIQGSTNGIGNWALILGEGSANIAGIYRYNQANGAYIDRPFGVLTDGRVLVTNDFITEKSSVGRQFYQAPGVNTGYALVQQAYANTSADRYAQTIYATDALGAQGEMYFRHLGGQFVQFNVLVSGQLFSMSSSGQGSSAGGWISTSDYRVKYDNKVIENALDKVDALVGYTGIRQDMADMAGNMPRKAHLFAQDVLKVLPEAVSVPKNYDPATNTGDLLALDYNGVVPLLVQAIKELRAQVRALQAAA